MQTQSLLTTSITLGQKNYPSAERQMAFFQRVEARLRQPPGAGAVALSDTLPPGGNHRDTIYAAMSVAGKRVPSGPTGGRVTWRWVSTGYFRALDIPILKGQGFSEEELSSSGRFVVLSKLLADRLFPEEDPIGRQIQLPKLTGPLYTVVGVAQNVKNGGLAGEDEPEYYRLRRNRAEDWDGTSAILLKTSLPPQIASQWMRAEISAVDATTPFTIETMRQRVDELAQGPRFVTALVSVFRGLRTVARGHRPLRHHFVCRRPAHTRDWPAYGSGREQTRHTMAHHLGGGTPHFVGRLHWSLRGYRNIAAPQELAV